MTRPDRTPLPRVTYAVAEVAAMTGLSEREVYRLAASGEMPSRKVGRRVLIPTAGFQKWLAKEPAS